MRNVLVVVSIDTEEDNWTPTRHGVTVENIRRLPTFHTVLRSVGARPTYFTSYQVSRVPWAAKILRDVAEDGAAELASHLHPWNTPPLREPLLGHNTMLKNLAPGLQRDKLRRLTETHSDAYRAKPVSFRAGRFGLGGAAIPALVSLGYQVDSSVVPFVDWRSFDAGPDFRGAPNRVYRLSQSCVDVRRHHPGGDLIEIPITSGFTRRPFRLWSRVHSALTHRIVEPLRIWGAASRSGLIRKVVLTPENETVADMLRLSEMLIGSGAAYLHLFLHSSSLQPGLSVFTRTERDVEALMERTKQYLEAVQDLVPVQFATVSEAAMICDGVRGSNGTLD